LTALPIRTGTELKVVATQVRVEMKLKVTVKLVRIKMEREVRVRDKGMVRIVLRASYVLRSRY
jgi:hypothetical protein